MMSSQVIPKGYQKTKVGVIPVDWGVVKIGDVFDFIKTYSNSRSDLSDIGDIEYLHYGDIHTKYKYHLDFDKNILPKIALEKFKANIEYVKNGDLFIADASEDYADIGKSVEVINLNNKKVVSGLHTFLLRDKNNNFSNGYKGLILYNQHISKTIKKIATGISVLGISKTNLGKLEIPLPPLKEQEKIANILTTWDSAISKQEELIKQKEILKKGLMQKLLSGEIRFDGFFDEWGEIKLGEVSEITTGSSNREDSGLTGKYTFFDRSEDIRTSDIFLFDGEAVIVAGEGQRFLPKFFIGKFDLHQRTYAIMNFKETSSKYIFYYIYQNSNYFLSQAVGSTVKSLRLPMFKKMPIKLPSLQEQQKIAEVLTNADKEIDLLKNELDELKEQKKGLMQKLLTGEVRVKV